MTYISVIIPTFNKAQLVSRVVQHFNNQSFKDFEIIIADDGSTDNTIRKIRMLRREERNLKIKIYNTGLTDIMGVCTAINLGLAYARGPVTFLLNDDMFLHTDCLLRHAEAHRKTKEQHAFIGPRFFVPPFNLGEYVGPRKAGYDRKKYLTKTIVDGHCTYRRKMMSASNISFNTELACKIGGYNEYFRQFSSAMDTEFHDRLVAAGSQVLFLYEAQAYSIRYGHEFYQGLKWMEPDEGIRQGQSVAEWKRQQSRYRDRQEQLGKQHKPPPIIRR